MNHTHQPATSATPSLPVRTPAPTISPAAYWQTVFALADDAKRSVEQVQRSLDSAMAVTGPMLTCPTCGSGVPHLRWRSTSEPTMTHLGGYCSACGRWLQWLPQVEPWVTLVVEQGCQGAP